MGDVVIDGSIGHGAHYLCDIKGDWSTANKPYISGSIEYEIEIMANPDSILNPTPSFEEFIAESDSSEFVAPGSKEFCHRTRELEILGSELDRDIIRADATNIAKANPVFS